MEVLSRPKLLAVDDEQSSLNAIYRTLRRQFQVTLAPDGSSALEVLKREDMAVLLADQRMPGMSGVDFFKESIRLQPDAMRILITGYTDIDAIIEAINEGKVFYYIHKPWEPEELKIIVRRAVEQYHLMKENRRLLRELENANQHLQVENKLLHHEVERQYSFEHIIGESRAMQEVFKLMKKVIPTTATVLLLGETGTGKELVARAIHFNGPRKDKLFLAQNCGALPDTLLESELFGHVRGAFTGATSDKKGLFELADGGTIFLDEIGDTSPAMQQRLLRVLQEGEVSPLGSEKAVPVDVRVISATNRDLEAEMRKGNFRDDLYYRLNVFPIRMPPLRERREDIPLLTNFFLEKYSRKIGKTVHLFSPEIFSILMSIDFRGNVRQLENIVERAVTLAGEDEMITPELLQFEGSNFSLTEAADSLLPQSVDQSLKEVVEALEKYYIAQTLQQYQGNISKSARQLGLSRPGLHKKLKRYAIDSGSYKQS